MPHSLWRRTSASLVGALALTLTVTATASPALAAPAKAEPVSFFPTDSLTVPDARQLTGRRVALPTQNCGPVITCGLVQRLNELDGFDLDPRLAITFSSPVDPAQIAQRITVQETRGGWRTGVDRVVHDPATNTIYAHPAEQLAPGTTYRLSVQGGPANKAARDTFTTLSATDGLQDLTRQIQFGSRALTAVGVTPGLTIDGVFPVAGTTVALRPDRGTLAQPVQPTAQLPADSRLVFGSYLAPSWLRQDVTIAQTPTRDLGPAPVAAARLPFVAVLPPGRAPAGGWPVAVFGHGFTASMTSVLLAAPANARSGIATIGTNVVGHGFGPGSTWEITTAGGTRSLPAYGRGVDQNGDGQIGNTEGSSATGDAAAISSRDALRQTSADISTLIRTLGGTDVDGDRTPDLSGQGVTYFGQSFGGIYATLLTGADPAVTRSVLNVPGGPITEIARLSPSFRLLTTQALQAAGLLNSQDATRAFFQEQLPLRGEGPVTATVPGALAIQDYLARSTWLTRSGSPEAFAPLIRPERVLVQVAFGDQTVPNPTSYTLVDAGELWSRTSLYRNDRAVTPLANPHSFLLVLTNPAAAQGQAQVTAFLGRGEVIDPDGAGAVWEVPVADPAVLLRLNFPQPALRP
ncbi:Ig-like domain-containing protein [Blastococcus litoris]|uniref:Ig-like domain-containing protein n=1 Tax=Blastococcus litoris TaxID=2171622 RepID=UPI0019D0DB9E|nr:Ig-like domain-containing protein [Blastococcus litoris]